MVQETQEPRGESRHPSPARRLQARRQPFGDIKPVGGPVSEMRFHIGAGYRVYFTTRGNVLMLLLAGGDKSTQQTDIKQAHAILDDYKEQQ